MRDPTTALDKLTAEVLPNYFHPSRKESHVTRNPSGKQGTRREYDGSMTRLMAISLAWSFPTFLLYAFTVYFCVLKPVVSTENVMWAEATRPVAASQNPSKKYLIS